jgi:hypothetical protein
MKKLLVAFLLLAPLALAEGPRAPLYPDDYKPQPCAPKDICSTLPRSEFGQIAKIRGFELRQEWVIAHWDEMLKLMHPMCEKVANCQAVPGNPWVWCKDIHYDDFVAKCDAFTDADDRKRCTYFVSVFFLGQDDPARKAQDEAQACAVAQAAGQPERDLKVWMKPTSMPLNFKGKLIVYAIDAETNLPVMANLAVTGPELLYPTESIDGSPVAGYAQTYTLMMNRVPRADGHRNVEVPVITISAPGYRSQQITLPIEKPRMTLEMSPKTLKRGKNSVTITARNAATGKPVELRVMGDDRAIGKTNVPFEVEWKKGEASPEIWVTSLYDLYDDVVLFKKTK